MDQQFFHFMGLQEDPFHVSPDPRFYYFSPAHEAALSEILYGIESRKGLMVLTGEAGTGKTSLLNLVLDWLHRRGRSCAFIFHTRLEPIGLLKIILSDFGVQTDSRSKSELVKTLHTWLLQRHNAGDMPVLILDEAQALPPQTLDELRLLLNLETPRGKLLQIILCGQPELDEKLQLRGLRQLHQRVMAYSRLPMLTEKETGAYILTRLATAQCSNKTIFPKDVVQEIFKCSEGIPRVVNLLCEHAMIAAYAQHQRAVTPEMIQRIALDFDLAAKPLGVTDEGLESSYERFGPLQKETKADSLASQYRAHWWSQIEFDAMNERAAADLRLKQEAAKHEADGAVAVASEVETKAAKAAEELPVSAPVNERTSSAPLQSDWPKRRVGADARALAGHAVESMQHRWDAIANALAKQGRKVSQTVVELRTRAAQARMTRARMARAGIVEQATVKVTTAKAEVARKFRGVSIEWSKYRLSASEYGSRLVAWTRKSGATLGRGCHGMTEPVFSYARSVGQSLGHDIRMLFRMTIPPTPALEHGASVQEVQDKTRSHRKMLRPIKHWLSQPIKTRNAGGKGARGGGR
jgi:general secretion pathway protein A